MNYDFIIKNEIEKENGKLVYIPMYVFDLDLKQTYKFKTQNKTTWQVDATTYTRLDNFTVTKSVIAKYNDYKLSKLNIGEYDLSKSIPYKDKIDNVIDSKEPSINYENFLNNKIEKELEETIKDYWVTTNKTDKKIEVLKQTYKSILVPVWKTKKLGYTEYTNGQNGKSYKEYSKVFTTTKSFLIIFVIGSLINQFVNLLSLGLVTLASAVLAVLKTYLKKHADEKVEEDNYTINESNEKYENRTISEIHTKAYYENDNKDIFKSKFNDIIENELSTIEDVYNLFKSFANNVYFEKINDEYYDYLIYFEDNLINDNKFYINNHEKKLVYNCYKNIRP